MSFDYILKLISRKEAFRTGQNFIFKGRIEDIAKEIKFGSVTWGAFMVEYAFSKKIKLQ